MKPGWFKPDREEYRNSAILCACERCGMTAEQALDELARHAAWLQAQCERLLLYQPPPPMVIVTSEDERERILCGVGKTDATS